MPMCQCSPTARSQQGSQHPQAAWKPGAQTEWEQMLISTDRVVGLTVLLRATLHKPMAKEQLSLVGKCSSCSLASSSFLGASRSHSVNETDSGIEGTLSKFADVIKRSGV